MAAVATAADHHLGAATIPTTQSSGVPASATVWQSADLVGSERAAALQNEPNSLARPNFTHILG